MCTINDNQMLYCSWAVPEIYGTCQMYFIFFILGYFLLLYPPNSPKIKVKKKMKKSLFLKILLIYKCVPKIMITWCTAPEIWTGRQTKVTSLVLIAGFRAGLAGLNLGYPENPALKVIFTGKCTWQIWRKN